MTEMVRRGARLSSVLRTRGAVIGDQSLTFDEVDQSPIQFANFLILNEGLGVGGRIGLLLNNSLLEHADHFACAKASLARVPLNSRPPANSRSRCWKAPA